MEVMHEAVMKAIHKAVMEVMHKVMMETMEEAVIEAMNMAVDILNRSQVKDKYSSISQIIKIIEYSLVSAILKWFTS